MMDSTHTQEYGQFASLASYWITFNKRFIEYFVNLIRRTMIHSLEQNWPPPSKSIKPMETQQTWKRNK